MAVNRERKIIRAYTERDVDIKWGTLKSALENIQSLIDQFGEDAYIDYSDRESLGVYADRPETDKEMNKRIAMEEQWEKQKLERDRQEFERLRKQFEQ